MAWVRIDDSFPDHPKAVQAGPMACWLYVCSIAYANRYLTDGFIPERQIWRLIDADDVERLADALIDAGLWEQAEGGYQIHDYLDYQPSAERVKEDRKHNAERQAKFRKRNGGSNAVTNGPVTPAPSNNPNTSQETRTRTETKTGTGTKKNDDNAHARAGSSSEPFDALVALCDATGTDVASLSGTVRGKQANKAKHLLASGMTVEEIGRLAGYCASQSWRSEPVDMFTVEKERGKWELAGKPAIAQAKPQANGRASPPKLSAFEQSMANIEKVEAMMNGTYQPDEQSEYVEASWRVK